MTAKRTAKNAKRTARKRARYARQQQRQQQSWTVDEVARFAAALRAGGHAGNDVRNQP